jgi:hypothetical protein
MANNADTRNVVPDPDNGWDVHKPGAKRASAHYDRQMDAIDRARQIQRTTVAAN